MLAGAVGEKFGDFLFGEAGEVGAGAFELAVEVVAFAGDQVAVGGEPFVFFVEPVAVVFDPGAVGLA